MRTSWCATRSSSARRNPAVFVAAAFGVGVCRRALPQELGPDGVELGWRLASNGPAAAVSVGGAELSSGRRDISASTPFSPGTDRF